MFSLRNRVNVGYRKNKIPKIKFQKWGNKYEYHIITPQ
jgi:hypothetical protein